jgi:hypothetical protein
MDRQLRPMGTQPFTVEYADWSRLSDLAVASDSRPLPKRIVSAISKAETMVATFGSLICPAKRFARSRSSSSVCWFEFGISVQITRRIHLCRNTEYLRKSSVHLFVWCVVFGHFPINRSARRWVTFSPNRSQRGIQSQPHQLLFDHRGREGLNSPIREASQAAPRLFPPAFPGAHKIGPDCRY